MVCLIFIDKNHSICDCLAVAGCCCCFFVVGGMGCTKRNSSGKPWAREEKKNERMSDET